MRLLLIATMILAPACATTLTFDTTALGTTTPLSLSGGGLTVNLSSPDGNVFYVANTFFSTISGRVLLDADFAAHALNLLFSQTLDSISLRFALNGDATKSLLLEAFAGGIGGTARGSVSATGTIPAGRSYPEGTISLSSLAGFNAVRLTSTAFDFAINDIDAAIHPSAVPEPVTMALVFAGVAAIAIRRRAKRA